MDALLLSLILCLAVEANGVMARACGRLSGRRYGTMLAMVSMAAVAVAATGALSAMWLAPLLTPEARALFLGAALAATGVTLPFAHRSDETVPSPSLGVSGSLAECARLTVAGLMGSSPLLIAGIAVYFSDPWLAGIGGALGCAGGCVAVREIGAEFLPILRRACYALSALLLVAAFMLATGALRVL